MREDEAKFRIHCRTHSRLHLGQIRPHRLATVSSWPRLCKNAIAVRFWEYQNPSRPQINRVQRILRGRRCRHLVSRGVFTQPRPNSDAGDRLQSTRCRSSRQRKGVVRNIAMFAAASSSSISPHSVSASNGQRSCVGTSATMHWACAKARQSRRTVAMCS
jgi:hypothetical protein